MAPGEPEVLWRLVSGKSMKRRFWILSGGSVCGQWANDSREVEGKFLFKGPVNVSPEQSSLTRGG